MRTLTTIATLLALGLLSSGCSTRPANPPADPAATPPVESDVPPSDVPVDPVEPTPENAGPIFPDPAADTGPAADAGPSGDAGAASDGGPKVLGAVGRSLFGAVAGAGESGASTPSMGDAPTFDGPGEEDAPAFDAPE